MFASWWSPTPAEQAFNGFAFLLGIVIWYYILKFMLKVGRKVLEVGNKMAEHNPEAAREVTGAAAKAGVKLISKLLK